MKRALVSFLMLCLIASSILTVSSAAAQPSEKIPVIIGFKGVPNTALVQASGGEIKYIYDYVPAIAASIPIQAIGAMKNNPVIAYVEPDIQAYALGQTVPWGVDRIDADLAWSSSSGAGIKVAIVDTGIDTKHADLSVKGGATFVRGTKTYNDDNGHGTHCAGIAAALDNDVGVVGVAPSASLYAVKVLNSQGSGFVSDIVKGIEWCITSQMQVVSMSFGSSSSSSALQDVCNKAYYSYNIILVAAAGNSGNADGTGDTVGYPAKYDSVIAVAATDNTDNRASWSSTGPAVELAAPGVSILSTLPGNSYGTYSGTSMACPHVSGTVALMLAKASLTPAQVRNILQSTAVDLGSAGFDISYGYGRIDAAKAVAQCVPSLTVSITNPTAGSTVSGTVLIQASVTNTAGTVSVTYTIDGGTQNAMSLIGDYYEAQWNTEQVADGAHTITVTANDGTKTAQSSITVTVDNIPNIEKTMSVTVTTDNPTYPKNSFAYITVTVKDSSSSSLLAGAAVTVTVTDPLGRVASGSGTTNKNGIAQFKYRIGPQATIGIYTITATASLAEYTTGEGTATFKVV